MSIQCTKCQGTGFLNIEQYPSDDLDIEKVLKYIKDNPETDIMICDCCGDGEDWYGEPGQHYTSQDPVGKNGPYAYNGGLCKCN